MTAIADFLHSFNPISLPELNQVQLLNRTDTKFIFQINRLESILHHCVKDYNVLTINELKYGSYETTYFDTTDHSLYINHHNGKSNRYKIRFRSYLDTNLNFFEIKFKSNKGRTIKERMMLHNKTLAIVGDTQRFLEERTPLKASTLSEAIQINYNRITLVNKSFTERLTIDFGMTYSLNQQTHTLPNLVIAEVKQDKNRQSAFLQIMHSQHLHPISISKYCLGIASFIPEIKTNSFKSKLLYVNKLCHTPA